MICKTAGDCNSVITFLFFNGFGSDYSYWNDLSPYFRNYNCIMLSENYFEPNSGKSDEKVLQQLEKLLKDKHTVGVGHSLGYQKLCLLQQKHPFVKLDKIVSVCGFSRYLGNDPILRPHRKAPLEMMKNSYAMNTFGTLMWFQMFCGQDIPIFPSAVNENLLLGDLKLLDDGVAPPDIPHLVLSSIDDYIIPFYIVEDNFRRLPDVEILYTENTGHLLGMKKPAWVYSKIMEFALRDADVKVLL